MGAPAAIAAPMAQDGATIPRQIAQSARAHMIPARPSQVTAKEQDFTARSAKLMVTWLMDVIVGSAAAMEAAPSPAQYHPSGLGAPGIDQVLTRLYLRIGAEA